MTMPKEERKDETPFNPFNDNEELKEPIIKNV